MARFRYGPLIAGGFGILDGSPDVRQFARKNRRALGIEFRVLIRQSLPPTTKYRPSGVTGCRSPAIR